MVICIVCGPSDYVPFSKKNGHDIFRCTTCGLIFVHPIPTHTIYGQDYFEGAADGFGYVNYDADKESMVPAFKKNLRHIDAALPARGKLLDVGAATGFFVKIAQDVG